MDTFALEADVPVGPHATWRARRLVEHELGGRVPADVLPDVSLMVTELVANGVRHGGGHAGTELRVVLELRSRALHVEVHNPGHASGAVGRRSPGMGGEGGLGLHIIDRLASRWGVHEGKRTAVWFELDCTPDALL